MDAHNENLNAPSLYGSIAWHCRPRRYTYLSSNHDEFITIDSTTPLTSPNSAHPEGSFLPLFTTICKKSQSRTINNPSFCYNLLISPIVSSVGHKASLEAFVLYEHTVHCDIPHLFAILIVTTPLTPPNSAHPEGFFLPIRNSNG
jgi:hypothetical protein